MLPRHPAAVAAVSVGLSHAPAPTSTLQGLVVCVVGDNKLGCFFQLSDVWLAGWSHVGRVCLSDASKLHQRSKKAVQPIETIGLYPLKWTSPRIYPARIWEYLHKIHKNWPFKSRNCTHFGDSITAVTQIHGNRQKSRYKSKITVITVIVNSWFTYIPRHITSSILKVDCNPSSLAHRIKCACWHIHIGDH